MLQENNAQKVKRSARKYSAVKGVLRILTACI